MSTVLALVQSACYRWNLPFPAAGTLFGNSDPGARQLLHVLYAVCEDLRQAACWAEQKRYYTFDTESGRSKYKLPEDWYAPSPFTDWNNDESLALTFLTDTDFAARVNGAIGSSYNFEARVWGGDSNPNTGGGQFEIYPVPTSVITLSFEYLTRSMFTPPYWLPSTPYDDSPVQDFVFVSNNIYQCDVAGTSSSDNPPDTQTQNIVDDTVRWGWVSTPYETILTDSDLCIFPDDLVKLGLRAKWRDEKGEESDKAEAEFQGKISKAASRLKPITVGSFYPSGTSSRRYVYPVRGGFI